METEEDFASYLDVDYGHGVTAVFTNTGGTASTINVILNNEYIEQDGSGVAIEATKPVAFCRSMDIPNIAHGNSLAVSAIKDIEGNILKSAQSYVVASIQSDRTGFTALILEKI
jgi:hypothetical protein